MLLIALSLPVATIFEYEDVESMLVTYPQQLIISEYFNFDRYGEIVLTSERHMTPTAEYEPGSPEVTQAVQDYMFDKITLDDGRTAQNPDPAIHPNGLVFDLTNLFRGGDIVQNVTGILILTRVCTVSSPPKAPLTPLPTCAHSRLTWKWEIFALPALMC